MSFAQPLRSAFAFVAAIGLASVSVQANASDADRAAAQALFDDARKLTAEKKYDEACPKLAESYRLDPSMGTAFYLADCMEHIGRLATAWTYYVASADAALTAGKKDREAFARRRADALKPRLAMLSIEVAQGARRFAGLRVQRDDAALGEGQWGVPIPVDPGSHRVSATAPGRKAWETTVEAKQEGTTITVSVPMLDPDTKTPAGDALVPPQAAPTKPGGGGSAQRIAGVVVGAVGIAGIGVGAGFGGLAISKKNESNAGGHCSTADICDPTGKALRKQSLQAAAVSTAAFIAGGVALAGGVVLFLTAPSSTKPNAALKVGPGGVSLAGTW